jgi:hypothetical protein
MTPCQGALDSSSPRQPSKTLGACNLTARNLAGYRTQVAWNINMVSLT